ncbi:MAG TPA: LuxR C-terminal-related transcriptional regulator [Kiloniellaceae bacterium]|nr:LuxR C-terminal-related transcriptional regulator [Kiloniellaceae bacterium]
MHVKPEIPEDIVAKWQRIVDILARIVDVPSGLIMKVRPPRHDVFVTSAGAENPYDLETSFELNTGLYCDTVMADRRLLIVRNASQDPDWSDNPDLKHGMVFYMGFPLAWPDGSLFGTICVLDREDNERATHYVDLLNEFKQVVEVDLKLLVELAERKRMETELQRAHDQLETRVAARTSELTKANEDLWQEITKRRSIETALRAREAELEETNTALKVLLQTIEDGKQETEARILWNINEQITPYLEKLKRLQRDGRSQAYLTLLESNLKEITGQFPNRLSTTFATLTPTEIEVAKLIRQGKTTKEIAGIMSIATSTIDFHRNNIRKKVGIHSSGVNLRSYLTSLA